MNKPKTGLHFAGSLILSLLLLSSGHRAVQILRNVPSARTALELKAHNRALNAVHAGCARTESCWVSVTCNAGSFCGSYEGPHAERDDQDAATNDAWQAASADANFNSFMVGCQQSGGTSTSSVICSHDVFNFLQERESGCLTTPYYHFGANGSL